MDGVLERKAGSYVVTLFTCMGLIISSLWVWSNSSFPMDSQHGWLLLPIILGSMLIGATVGFAWYTLDPGG